MKYCIISLWNYSCVTKHIALHSVGRQPQTLQFKIFPSNLPNLPCVRLYSTPVLPLACHPLPEAMLLTHSMNCCVTLSTFLLQAKLSAQPSLVQTQHPPPDPVLPPVAILSAQPPQSAHLLIQSSKTTMSCLLPFPLWQCCWWWS